MSDDKVNILMVDDREENLLALQAVLEPLGENLIRAASASEALRHLIEMEFAVILLDVQMPNMDGFELAGLIRKRKQTFHTPIIFITANNQSSYNVSQGYSAGAIDYLFKPFDPYVLRSKVAAFVQLAKNTRALQNEIARRVQAEAEVKQLNKELERKVSERTASIESLNKTLQLLLRETHHRVKNNLQLLSAIIDMLIMENEPTVSSDELDRLASHVRTLGFVHDLITEQSSDNSSLALLPVDALLSRIVSLIQQMKRTQGRYIVHSHLDTLLLPARECTTLALIANELCANAIKHGKGEVEVSFEVSDHEAVLEICDDGPGFEDDFNASQDDQHGLMMVESLAQHDLSGKVRYSNRENGGARVSVSIPLGK